MLQYPQGNQAAGNDRGPFALSELIKYLPGDLVKTVMAGRAATVRRHGESSHADHILRWEPPETLAVEDLLYSENRDPRKLL